MADEFLHNLTDSWNSALTQFNGIKMNVTDSASAADSNLLLLQIGAEDKFAVRKDGTVVMTNNDPGAESGPGLVLFRNSASPAVDDIVGRIRFLGKDDLGNTEDYSEIKAVLSDVTDGSEDANLLFGVMVDGTMTTVATLGVNGFSVSAIDGTPIGENTPANGSFLDLSFTGTLTHASDSPLRILHETDGATSHNKLHESFDGGIFRLQTVDNANALVSTDYEMTLGASGAVSHSWRVGNAERLKLDQSGLDVIGSLLIGAWSSTNADIDAIVSGTSAGTLLSSLPNGHLTLALREDEATDGFQIISGGGDYGTDEIFDTLAFQVLADGVTTIGGNTTINGTLTVTG